MAKVMYMAGEVSEAVRVAEAGADVLVAQGTEAGGQVMWMASLPLVPMMVKAIAPLPAAESVAAYSIIARPQNPILCGKAMSISDSRAIHEN